MRSRFLDVGIRNQYTIMSCVVHCGLLLLMFAAALGAQSFHGSIVGTVADASGGSISGASVTLTSSDTNERKAAPSGADGAFRFVDLNPGNYRLEIEQPGFKRQTRTNVQVEVAAVVRVDVSLEVGDTTQSVVVTDSAPLIQSENATLSQVIDQKTVQEMPLNGRNVLNLVALVPGVVPQGGSMGNLQGQNIFAAGNFQIGGGQANQSASFLDGAPLNVNYGNLTTLVPTQDAISEFRVQVSNNTAEYGRYTGGVINLLSKSGTNQFHGSAYEFLRNRSLNSSTFFANATGAGKPAYVQNQYGGTVGGPVKKDRLFIFGSYEAYRQRSSNNFITTVPTAPMLTGDFSGYRNTAGAVIPIYDPLTTCGRLTNAACPAGATITRSQFPNNTVPTSRIDPFSRQLSTKLFGAPNSAANQFTNLLNFSANVPSGGDNDQGNVRVDHTVSEKQRIFGRYTQWTLANIGGNAYSNSPYYVGGSNPENFTTYQATIGDTYSISPTMVADVRASFLRFSYDRDLKTPAGSLDLTSLGLPSYFKSVFLGTYPTMSFSGDYGAGGGQRISSRNNSYALSGSVSKFVGKHQLKVGGEGRRVDSNFFQINSPGGAYTFSNVFTSRNALSPGASGNSLASFLIGSPSVGTLNIPNITASNMYYQGYYITDTWQPTQRLTLTLGLRYEVPGTWRERNNNMATFNPLATNSLVSLNGQPLKGAFDLVASEAQPGRGLKPEKLNLFAPRIGGAYRLNSLTVIRGGGGLFFTPADAVFVESPYQNAVNIASNAMVSTVDSQQTPSAVLSNPFPNGLILAPGRSSNYQRVLLGGNFNSTSGGGNSAILANSRQPYMLQWNFGIQRQLPTGMVVEVAYAGSRGVHLPNSGTQLNQLADKYLSLGSQLVSSVANPFLGIITSGPLSQPTVQYGQLLRPFPQYQSVIDAGGYTGTSSYHAMTVRTEKRYSAGTILGAYTFSKIMGNIETSTPWLESGQTATFQNFNNLNLEKSISSFDARQRLTLSYVVGLPFGKGHRFLSGVTGLADKVISGWAVNGVSTFQKGFPLGFTSTPNLTNSFGGNSRPNLVADCVRNVEGAVQGRINKFFNTACYTAPAAYTFGNASRTDAAVRGPGIANYDFSLVKKTSFRERYSLEFRAEIFNLFNRVQFGRPNTAQTVSANNTFGVITTQANGPRLIQMAMHLRF